MKTILLNAQTLRRYWVCRPVSPIILALSAAILWALIENLGALLPTGYSSYQIVWVRYGVHLILVGFIWFLQRKKNLVRTSRYKAQILRGLLMLGMPLCFIFAVRTMAVNNVWDILWLAPLVVMGFSSLFLKEYIQKHLWIAAGIVLIGSVVILPPSLPISLKGIVLALGVMVCFSLYMVATRILATEDILTSLFYTAAVVFVPLTILMPFVWKELTVSAFLIMALIGVAGFGLLFSLDRMLETSSIGRIAPILASEPVWFVLINSILLRIPLHIRGVADGLLILVVGVWAYITGASPHSGHYSNPFTPIKSS